MEMEADLVPSSFLASQRYCPESEDLMGPKRSCCPWFKSLEEWSVLTLNQVYLAAGLASLLQLRVTELPSTTSPEGLTVTEGVFGASDNSYISFII